MVVLFIHKPDEVVQGSDNHNVSRYNQDFSIPYTKLPSKAQMEDST